MIGYNLLSAKGRSRPSDRVRAVSEQPRKFDNGQALQVAEFPDFVTLFRRNGVGPTTDATTFSGRGKAVVCPLHDPLPLELGDRCKDMKSQAISSRFAVANRLASDPN